MVILFSNQHSIPPSVGYDSEDVNGQVYDLDKAKECLEAAGYSDSDGDGIVDKDGRICPLQFLLPMVLQQQ